MRATSRHQRKQAQVNSRWCAAADRARITFAAGLDWDGTKRASARFVLMRNFARPRYSFFEKEKRGNLHWSETSVPGQMSSTSRPGFGLLLRETREDRQPEHIMQRCSDNCASLRSRRCIPRLGVFYSQTTNYLSVIHHDVLPQADGQAWTRN